MKPVLALTKDGAITFCYAPEEKRGMGRCNHIKHQLPNQSTEEFISTIENFVKVHEDKMPDEKKFIDNIVQKYSCNVENPDWEDMIKNLNNPFTIGSKEDGTYEEAKLIKIDKELVEKDSGSVYKLTAYYEFRGKQWACDYGEIPYINPDDTITINGVNWRVLPVLSKYKAGVISYGKTVTLMNKDGRNVSISLSKDQDSDEVKIKGDIVPIDEVEKYLQTGESSVLNKAQKFALDQLDPVCFERFPDLRTNLRQLKELPADEISDLNWRRCYTYKDMVKDQYEKQLRRMGVTFRTNLAKRKKLEENGKINEYSEKEIDDALPLFYQVNLTDNVQRVLVKSSNVQNVDNLNPISALSQSQKVSLTGPGGYYKDNVPYELRMPHRSHEGIVDSMDVSSGKNIGLSITLGNGRINSKGFIEPKKDNESLTCSDFIPYKLHNDPNRGIMAVAHLKQACPILGGEDPIVKTPAWGEISGAKLGVNLRVAYIPSIGDFEDSVILSRSAADKMTTIQSHKYSCNDTSSIKVGQKLERKQQIGNVTLKIGGVVKSIDKDGFELETIYKMTPGDKIAGRHGNKSTVSKILEDDEMPRIINEKTGEEEPVQIIMSPLSVAGRKNIGQIMETNEGYGYGPDINHVNDVVLNSGKRVKATSGKQFIMRLNHIAEKKLSSHSEEMNIKREAEGGRIGEMESILLSTTEDRLKILDYLRHQEAYDSHKKLHSLLKSIGVDLQGVNWDD